MQKKMEEKMFDQWFNGSKVVDEQKRPLKVYHGTKTAFDVFETDPRNKSSFYGIGFSAIGSYFSESYEIASHYPVNVRLGESRKVMAVYLAIQNPKKYRAVLSLHKDMLAFCEREGLSLVDGSNRLDHAYAFMQDLMNQGYDGITFMEGKPSNTTKDKARVWVVFKPEQIHVVSTEEQHLPKERQNA